MSEEQRLGLRTHRFELQWLQWRGLNKASTIEKNYRYMELLRAALTVGTGIFIRAYHYNHSRKVLDYS
jgi:hypothetical protein